VPDVAGEGVLRIGELSKRSGVSAELLRAWERRYGLLEPQRSAGGLRLYSGADVDRVRRMRRHLATGLAAAEAAALARREETPAPAPANSPATLRAELADALASFDEPRAQAVIDQALAATTVDTMLAELILPYLHELGDRWQRGETTIAHEHFASGILRGRLLGLARGWGLGMGPAAVLACLPAEQHDLGLIAFGVALRARGWRIVYLGPDTPLDTVEEAARETRAELVMLSAALPERVRALVPRLRALAGRHRLVLGGPGAEPARAAGLTVLAGDPVAEAAALS